MSPWLGTRLARVLIAAAMGMLPALRATAHDSFDMSARIVVTADAIELTSTFGRDGIREVFVQAGLPDEQIRHALQARGAGSVVVHGPAMAARFFTLEHDGQPLEPTSTTTLSEGMEVILTIVCPRPKNGRLEVRAMCYRAVSGLKTGSMVIADDFAGQLGAALLSAEADRLSVSLPSAKAPPAAEPAPRPSFRQFFVLGVEHILAGIDHLLFLAALLLGVSRIAGMLGVITCFTLAHSVTLALAALNVVSLPSRVVEPLIALSIVVACIGNLWRRDSPQDRGWLAAGFGLIHGFGFASALRDTGLGESGGSVAASLTAFNLGVEAGQLAVAGALLPLLFWVRRWQSWSRYGVPAVSSVIVVVGTFWAVQRLGGL